MTIVLEIVVVAAVVYVIAAYLLGHVGGMSTPPPDSGAIGLPPGRLDPRTIDGTRFGLAFRGYRMAEVDEVLDRLRDEVAARDTELAQLRDGAVPDVVSPEPDVAIPEPDVVSPERAVGDDQAREGGTVIPSAPAPTADGAHHEDVTPAAAEPTEKES